MGYRFGWVLLVNLMTAAAAWAAPTAWVDTIQSPAWLERGGQAVPLSPGLEVRSGDRLRTGPGARVYVRLVEGSTVKLGESTRATFYSRGVASPSQFRGALEVQTGAFRFTTDLARKLEEREVVIRVGAATIGIRGTDVWGKATAEQDLVMLLEGRVDVTPIDSASFIMHEPLQVYLKPRGQIGTLARASAAEVQSRARETEIIPGAGAIQAGGEWALFLGPPADEPVALDRYDQARRAGFPVHIRPLFVARGPWNYQVLLPGFADEAEASAAAPRVQSALGLPARIQRLVPAAD